MGPCNVALEKYKWPTMLSVIWDCIFASISQSLPSVNLSCRMSSTKPTILLIPGAWHRGEAWSPVTTLLQEQGYHVEAVTLPSAGGSPSSTMTDDAEHIRTKHLDDLIVQGRDVIVVMHSYSGIPGTECIKGMARKDLAAQGKPGGVIALVYVAAFLIPAGESLGSALPGNNPSIIAPGDVCISNTLPRWSKS